jgi:DNA-binding CsgD family transcriptional regulator
MREQELHTLSKASPAAVVLGEPGIGKTMLLRIAAKQHEGPVFRVTCQRIARDLRLDPLISLLQTVARQLGWSNRSGTDVESDAILTLRIALERITKDANPLVQIDDLHWADEATLEALPYLVERLQDFPVRWQFGARNGYDSVTEMLHRLRRGDLAITISLTRLADDEIAEIVRDAAPRLDEKQRSIIVMQAGGNPLYAQLLSTASSERAIALVARDHVSDLSEVELRIAAALAIVEQPLDDNAIAELSHLAPGVVSKATAALLARGILELRDMRVAIRHDVLVDAIASVTPKEALSELHLAASRLTRDEERRARHLLAADFCDESRAIFAKLAWDAMANEDWNRATRCFLEARAISETPRTESPLADPECIAAGLHLAQLVLDVEQRNLPHELPPRWERLPAVARARLELAAMVAFIYARQSLSANDRARIAVLTEEDIEPEIAAEILYQLARASRILLEHDAARDFGRKLRDLVPHLGQGEARYRAAARSAAYFAIYDDWDDGIARFQDAIRQGVAAGALDAVLQVTSEMLVLLLEAMRLDEGLALGRFAYGLEGGNPVKRARVARRYSDLLTFSSRLPEALSIATAARAMEDTVPARSREIPYVTEIVLATQLGLVEQVQSLIEECTRVGAKGTLADLAIGYFHEQHGDAETATALLEGDFESPFRAHPHNLRYALTTLARIALQTRDEALMERTLRRLRALVGYDTLTDACVGWGEAYGHLLRGENAAALPLLQDCMQAPLTALEKARIQFEIATVTRRSEDVLDAIERFQSLGIGYMVERVRQLAREIGLPVDERNPASILSDRERTVALMVSSGKTNAEVAASLTISKRTVEQHVDNIRRKLGVRSRVEIAMLVANGAAFKTTAHP